MFVARLIARGGKEKEGFFNVRREGKEGGFVIVTIQEQSPCLI